MISEKEKSDDLSQGRKKSNLLINGALVVGLLILVICQLIVFGSTMQQRTKVANSIVDTNTAQDGSTNPSRATLTASDIQLVACTDDDLLDAVAAAKPGIVNIDVISSDVGSTSAKGGPPLDFDMPSTDALVTNQETLGSGIIVDAHGYILTCYHIIKDYPVVYITLFGADRKMYKANVVEADVSNDLVILKISPDYRLPVAKLANSDLVRITDTVLAIGSPFGFEYTVTEGIISDNKRSVIINGVTYYNLFQTDAAINRGSAGGALINSEGEVIGINTAIASTSEYFAGVSFAIPINRARALLLKAIKD